jgi:hypothetical protein
VWTSRLRHTEDDLVMVFSVEAINRSANAMRQFLVAFPLRKRLAAKRCRSRPAWSAGSTEAGCRGPYGRSYDGGAKGWRCDVLPERLGHACIPPRTGHTRCLCQSPQMNDPPAGSHAQHGHRPAEAVYSVSLHRTDSDGGAVPPFRVTPAAHQKGKLLGSRLQPEDARAGVFCRDERLAANAARQVSGFGLVPQEYRYFSHPRIVP